MKELLNFSIWLSIRNIVKSLDEGTNRFNIREEGKKDYNNLLNYNNCNQHLQLRFYELHKCSNMQPLIIHVNFIVMVAHPKNEIYNPWVKAWKREPITSRLNPF
jgi:hypothetical protein